MLGQAMRPAGTIPFGGYRRRNNNKSMKKIFTLKTYQYFSAFAGLTAAALAIPLYLEACKRTSGCVVDYRITGAIIVLGVPVFAVCTYVVGLIVLLVVVSWLVAFCNLMIFGQNRVGRIFHVKKWVHPDKRTQSEKDRDVLLNSVAAVTLAMAIMFILMAVL